jgi:hypothetical protein
VDFDSITCLGVIIGPVKLDGELRIIVEVLVGEFLDGELRIVKSVVVGIDGDMIGLEDIVGEYLTGTTFPLGEYLAGTVLFGEYLAGPGPLAEGSL